MITVIFTSSARHLIPSFAKDSFFKCIESAPNTDGTRLFPDGEVFVHLPRISKKHEVVVVHAGAPHPNRGLMELEMTLTALAQQDARSPSIFFTYLPYGMQDKAEKGKRSVAEELLKKCTEYYKVKRIFAIDPHFGKAPWTKSFPFVSVSALPLLMEKAIRTYGDITFFSPDKGQEARSGISGVHKKRADSYTVSFKGVPRERMRGQIVGVADDIIETGNTLVSFGKLCKKEKPKRLVALGTHGVLREGVMRARTVYDRLFLSNTIASVFATVDVSPLIKDTLRAYARETI